MPEYLSPGVYIELVPPRLRAIEGVSTSTLGFVGPARRGPMPGDPLPFRPTSASGLTLPLSRDPAPVLVTSFADFVRTFGEPMPFPDPSDNAYLAPAVRAFFDNGGKRCYVARVVHWPAADAEPTATRTTIQLDRGPVVRLARRARQGGTELFLNSLRGIEAGDDLTFESRAGNPDVTVTVASYDTAAGEVRITAGLTQDLDPTDVFARTAGFEAGQGPRFHARSRGSWSAGLKINVVPADKGPVRVAQDTPAASTTIQVASTTSFYRGAIVEIDTGSRRVYNEVVDLLPGNVLQLDNQVSVPVTIPIIPAPPAPPPPLPFVRVVEIDVTISDDSGPEPVTETFRSLTWNPSERPETRRRYYAAVINARSRLVYVQPPNFGVPPGPGAVEAADIDDQPTTANGFDALPAAARIGGDGHPGDDDHDDYIGRNPGPGLRTGLHALQDVDDISVIAVPGRTADVVHNAMITQCESLRYRFAILDAERDPAGGSVNAILGHRNLYDSAYAAYYSPWLETAVGRERRLYPPSGYLAGIYARTDTERGVHKAPANEVVRGVTGLQAYFTTGEQDILNPRGVNLTRRFTGRGTRVWGARTLSSDPALRYVPTVRYLIFLSKSIDRGTQYVVFEPNGPDTWSRVVDSITAFLHGQWRSGALLGRTPEQAFFVRCDETTMTVDDIENGRLICNIGVAIIKPAEFVIFRIEQISAFAEAA